MAKVRQCAPKLAFLVTAAALLSGQQHVTAFVLSCATKGAPRCGGVGATMSASSSGSDRRDFVKLLFAGGTAFYCEPSFAQRPPPRPNIKTLPQECLQAGTCAIAGSDLGLPQFKTSEQSPEILDPKPGRYSAGLKIQDISVGDMNGTPISEGKFVSLQYVLRRSNGYYVDASYGFDRFDTYDFKFGKGQVVPGFEQAIAGMRPGGRRRFILPPELGYTGGVGEGKPGPIPPGWGERRALDSHRGEPLVFEVQIVKVK